jgi:hypothetical protein
MQEANMKEALAKRDKMRAKLEQVAGERDRFQAQVLRKDFDITHLRAIKAIMSDRVADLERVVALHADLVSDLGRELGRCCFSYGFERTSLDSGTVKGVNLASSLKLHCENHLTVIELLGKSGRNGSWKLF